MWRTTPIYRSEAEGSLASDRPPDLPSDVDRTELQVPEDGSGPLFHRRYRVRIRDSRLTPAELLDRVACDPDRVAPSEFATFRKVKGDERTMKPGDEFVVRMAAPWDGPVRVACRGDTEFRLMTLEGHLEAGQIEFRARSGGGHVVFEIESWARNKDRLTNFLYDRLRMSKEVQLHMWTSTLERIVKLSGGELDQGIEIHTRKVAPAGLDG
jgi:hypothetical protein